MESSLGMFLLQLVAEGISTPYALKKVGLSVGSTRPALQRLEALGYLKRGAPQSGRRKQEFILTKAGRQALKQPWPQNSWWENTPTDLESILRGATMAWMQGNRSLAQEILAHSAEAWHARSLRKLELASSAERLSVSKLEFYRWATLFCEAKRLSAESAALKKLKSKLRR